MKVLPHLHRFRGLRRIGNVNEEERLLVFGREYPSIDALTLQRVKVDRNIRDLRGRLQRRESSRAGGFPVTSFMGVSADKLVGHTCQYRLLVSTIVMRFASYSLRTFNSSVLDQSAEGRSRYV